MVGQFVKKVCLAPSQALLKQCLGLSIKLMWL
jgi:hypothetical protein